MASDKILQVTEDTFDALVLGAELPVLVDFWADWCGPCRMIAPILDQLADEFDSRVIVAKINVDEQPELARKYDIMTIPTIMTFRGNEILEKNSGVIPKSELENMLERAINN